MFVMILVPQNVFSQMPSQTRMLYGTVYSAITGEPLPAIVTVAGCGYSVSTATGPDGSWKLNYAYGHTGRITFSAPGYTSQAFEITSNVQWFYTGGILSLQPLIR